MTAHEEHELISQLSRLASPYETPPPVRVCEFERLLARLGLDETDEAGIRDSQDVREWVRLNRNRYFVPEELLSHFVYKVNANNF